MKSYEDHVSAEMKKVLRPGMTFVDIGANLGYFTMMAALLVGNSGKVIAFEAYSDNCSLIRMSLLVNGFRHVTVHCYAVADRQDYMFFDVDPGTSNGFIWWASGEPTSDLVVPTVRLDDILRDEPRVDVLKIDIEDFEGIALRDMGETLRRHHPIVFTEFFPGLIKHYPQSSPEVYLRELQAFGYDFYILPRDGSGRGEQPNSIEHILEVTPPDREYVDLVAYPR
ncbi:MAG: hypothetical protein KatS3mg057_2657 [Herpetosiphonaceae bacterium]|nr:MAG: hypothetical protein KatS3mg057_2657 [Herpetosiphonaceae bacterium]